MLIAGFRLVGLLLKDESGEGLPVEAGPELQVAAGDLFLLRAVGRPARSLRQQFLHFVGDDEVMLLIVEDRDQGVRVRQQFRERRFPGDRHGEVRTLDPLGKALVDRMVDRFDRVAERLEDGAEEPLAASDRQHVESGFQAGSRWTPARTGRCTCPEAPSRRPARSPR